MKILILTLCTFANDYSVEQVCQSYRAVTDDCSDAVAKIMAKHEGTPKEVLCTTGENIKHSKIYIVPNESW
jgi:hypothetical protein